MASKFNIKLPSVKELEEQAERELKKIEENDFGDYAQSNLFSTQKDRDIEKMNNQYGKIKMIKLDDLVEFKDHPFKVMDDEKMNDLIQSIHENGIIYPIIVRKVDDKYEIVSGHRRYRACELLGYEEVPCLLKNLTDDEATIFMAETNFQTREEILPSEKAFAYKMMLDAMKRQAGRRSKKNSSPVATNLKVGRSDKELAEQLGESKDQIRRYIRLTNLYKSFLDIVDDGKLGLRPAVELSYIDMEDQIALFELCKEIGDTKGLERALMPNHDQAIRLRKLSETNWNIDMAEEILNEKKANQKEKITITNKEVYSMFPTSMKISEVEKIVKDLVKNYCMEHYGTVNEED